MVTQVIELVQGDTRPTLNVTLTDKVTGDPIILTGASVKMYFREYEGTTLLDTLTGIVTNPSAGIISLAWNPTTLNVPEGDYEGEIEVTFSDTTIQSVFIPLIFFVREQFDQ